MNNTKVCLGAIVGVHGIKGEVKVKCFCDNEKHLDSYGVLTNKDDSKTFEIKVVGHSKDLLRVKIKGVDDRNTAETYVGEGFYIKRDKLPVLQEEEYYHADLIGLDVINTEDCDIGVVNAIYNFGAGDILEIRTKTGILTMLPFNRTFVPVIDIKNGRIIIEMSLEDIKEENDINES